jgi:cytidylate kinase
MSVIAISRGSLIAAKRLAESLGERLGAKVVDRDGVIAAAERYGIDRTGISRENIASEIAPGFWEEYADARHHYLACFKAALLDLAVQGPLVYHGNLAHILLSEVPCVLRVRVIAPKENRVAMLMEERGYTEERAIAEVKEMDTRRRRWTYFLYERDSENPVFFDVILNLHKMTIGDAVDLIAAEIEKPPFKRTEESLRRLADLRLAAVVETHLLHAPETYGLRLGVRANASTGEVAVIKGSVAGEAASLDDTVRGILAGVEGVRTVKVEMSS